jgi:hypothetical protein
VLLYLVITLFCHNMIWILYAVGSLLISRNPALVKFRIAPFSTAILVYEYNIVNTVQTALIVLNPGRSYIFDCLF